MDVEFIRWKSMDVEFVRWKSWDVEFFRWKSWDVRIFFSAGFTAGLNYLNLKS